MANCLIKIKPSVIALGKLERDEKGTRSHNSISNVL